MLFGHYPFDPAVKDFADRLACGRWAPPGAADIASPACLALLGRMLHPIAAQVRGWMGRGGRAGRGGTCRQSSLVIASRC